MLFINGKNGYIKIESQNHENNTHGSLMLIPVETVIKVGASSHFEEDIISLKCREINFTGFEVELKDPCAYKLYTIENNEGFVLVEKANNTAFVSESLHYINLTASNESTILSALVEAGYTPPPLLVNDLFLRTPIDFTKLKDDTHGLFDFQWGDDENIQTLKAVVDLDTLGNQLNGNLLKKTGTITSLCDFEVNYENPQANPDAITEKERMLIGAIKLHNFKFNQADYLLSPLLFKTAQQFKHFKATMLDDNRSEVLISRPSLHGFGAEVIIQFGDELTGDSTEATIKEMVIFPNPNTQGFLL